ncbi:SipW-dependent-type signal peptide-containing protein [Gordonia sp. (in: high G+C Gram-positive bacteria)]|uniref:SipW-dependent-type signal peptide-containing protein n=1 Tax=Gordonia sp. (in: high G+C Gram-positive bacteria) TaxID=84139 RepID=UPI003C76BCFB
MSSPHESGDTARSGLRRRLGETGWTRARAIASLGMVLGLGAVGTMAAWSDTASATTGQFSTASVDVKIALDSKRPTLGFTSLNKINLGKGDSTAAMLPVNNLGASNFTYTMKAVAADAGTFVPPANVMPAGTVPSASDFASNLTVTVYAGGSASGGSCTGGTQIGTGTMALGSPVNLVTTARPVNVAATENLCIQATLSSGAPVTARMSAVSIDFQFVATQA